MKHTLTFLLFSALSLTVFAQNPIQLNIDHKLGAESFTLNQDADQYAYIFDVSRLQYYISGIEITHDGGTVTALENTWLLVNANGTEDFDLGTLEITQVESISFYVGVGSDVNHDDPAAWPNGSSLAPQNPSMHWGWASGYRFVAMEGRAGPSGSDNLYEIHALGDNNYFQAQVTVNSSLVDGVVRIPLNADYVHALDGIDVSAGLINHSTSGVSVPLLQNFSTSVFTASVVSSVEQFDYAASMMVSPNPSTDQASLQLELPAGQGYSYNIVDVNGRLVAQDRITMNSGRLALPSIGTGIYLINLMQEGVTLNSMRWVVE